MFKLNLYFLTFNDKPQLDLKVDPITHVGSLSLVTSANSRSTTYFDLALMGIQKLMLRRSRGAFPQRLCRPAGPCAWAE